MHDSQNRNDGRPRSRQGRKPRAGAVIAVVALVSFAAVACSSGEAERAAGEDQRPGTAPSSEASPIEGPFGQVGGWIAYNDGTGLWAVDPGKAYPGTFSPSDYPDDAVRLAGPAVGDPIAWSADGSKLLVLRETLFVLDADGTETRVTDSAGYYEASISPDGTQVVYARGIGPGGDHPFRLEVATVGDGPPAVLLSSEEGHLDTPAFSPDGRRIAYIDGGGDHSNALWVIDADGSNRRKLAGGDWSHVDHLVWSPDGERLAFSCGCPAGGGVYTIRADGSRLTLVSADENMPVPQWSPDGSQIALVHEDFDIITVGQPTTGTLVVVGAEGGEERQLARFQVSRVEASGDVRQLRIAWNPAASVEPSGAPAPSPAKLGALAYGVDGDIYVAEWDGSNAVRIADGRPPNECGGQDEYWGEGPIWSPDGRYLAYRRTNCEVPGDARWHVVISDPEGNVLAEFPGDGWRISWSSDSTRVAVWASLFETIGVFGLDGERQALLTVPPGWLPGGDHDPMWLPDGNSLLLQGVVIPIDGSTPYRSPSPADRSPAGGTYSPDGSRVAYVARRALVVAEADGSSPQVMFDDWVWNPVWSPTDDRIAFTTQRVSGRGVPNQLQLLNVATGTVKLLAEADGSDMLEVIDFSPEGDRILFSREEDGPGSLWTVNADGSDLRRVFAGTAWADGLSPGPTP